MLREDEDSLVCDFAETYHILDIRSLPAKLAATLAAGLSDNSRIKRHFSGMSCTTETLLLALIADAQNLSLWSKSKPGSPKPESLADKFMGNQDKESDTVSVTAEEFDRIRQELLKGGEQDG
ncbi:hypothetical protein [Faecalibaculum rodentium]|uniref:hypothetical protein n=1 Tax=Faecalibaculum rodentium TaxID=1702221 RepID=UPI0023F13FEE|nr:hypothetical protein [Faecalibaculum rodentium]